MKKKRSVKRPTRKTVKRPVRKTVKRTVRKTIARKPRPSVKQKFKLGDFVYSSLNPTEKRQISEVKELKTGVKGFVYKLILSDSKGRPKKSKWISERSLSRRK